MTHVPEKQSEGDGLGDSGLTERARAGDREARSELLVRARGPLVVFCARYVGNLDEAEDAAQDALIRLAENSWPRGSLRAWIFRVARNGCLDRLRQRRDGRFGAGSSFGSSIMPSPGTGPGTAAVREEEHEHLREHLAELSRDHAEVILLSFYDGLSRKEIAEVLELRESIVKSRLFEAVKELRRRTGGKP